MFVYKKIKCAAVALFAACSVTVSDAAMSKGELFENSYYAIDAMRTPEGMYRDKWNFYTPQDNRGSIANVGVGIMALCIADSMGWENNAQAKVIQTLETVTNGAPTATGYIWIDRNETGYYRHFFDTTTGANVGNSEYSTIDTAILASAALFAKNYFQNGAVSYWAERVYRGVDWSRAIADPNAGTIFLEMQANGFGVPGQTTSTFNEYMIVAYLAMLANNGNGGAATSLWNNYYGTIPNLPTSGYWQYSLLTDAPGTFISGFIPQFNYFYCNAFSSNTQYVDYLRNAADADALWFTHSGYGWAPYCWGVGAGASPVAGGYNADKIANNPWMVVSPHIIGGYSVGNVYSGPNAVDYSNDLAPLEDNFGASHYYINGRKIIWRFSLSDPNWKAQDLQGIDYSSMLFGLASLYGHCGPNFFNQHNNYAGTTHWFHKYW